MDVLESNTYLLTILTSTCLAMVGVNEYNHISMEETKYGL
jgi:hypothetical protein